MVTILSTKFSEASVIIFCTVIASVFLISLGIIITFIILKHRKTGGNLTSIKHKSFEKKVELIEQNISYIKNNNKS